MLKDLIEDFRIADVDPVVSQCDEYNDIIKFEVYSVLV